MKNVPITDSDIDNLLDTSSLKNTVSKEKLIKLIKLYETIRSKRIESGKENARQERLKREANLLDDILDE